MQALRALSRLIHIKRAEGAPQDVRLFVGENLGKIADALGLSADMLRAVVDDIDDDTLLARQLVIEVERTRRLERQAKTEARRQRAHEVAEAVGGTARYREASDGHGCWEVDIGRVLAGCLTDRRDVLVFAASTFSAAVRMAPLFRLRRLRRRDLAGFVDEKAGGLRIRWRTGGLNLPACSESAGGRVVVHLPSISSCTVAA
jgi:hypothetical protein